MSNFYRVLAVILITATACTTTAPTAIQTQEVFAVPPATHTSMPTLAPTSAPTEATTSAPPTETATQEAVLDTAARLESLGGEPCPVRYFTCITLEVPYDHFNPDGRTLKVVFAVQPASGERKGLFVTANGGPGSFGLWSADDYSGAFDSSIPEHFDVVFFDQRGVGQSGGVQCIEATAAFYRADWEASTPDEEAALVETARTFAGDCVEEMGNPETLPYLGTEQAVEDLETFVEAMGEEKFWLYGESYGTQFAQTYAAAHPERLAGLILDGTVDLTLDGYEFSRQQAAAFNDVLEQTLQACDEDEACAADMGSAALEIYDTLAGKLREEAQAYEFPLGSGGTASRQLSFSDLESAASGFLYSEDARMLFLRALAYYARDLDPVPMGRVLYSSLVLNPETEEPVLDPFFSDAAYYAIKCLDYGYPGDTPEEAAENYLRAGDELNENLPRMASIYYGDLPCVFWPNRQTETIRPAALEADGIPTLVLGSTANPATPTQQGVDVFERLEDGYLVMETGGPHHIFGWGVSCVDELVTAFLVEDQMPARETTCEGVVADEFAPLMPREAADFADPLEVMAAVDEEIYYLTKDYNWDLEPAVGCPYGGTLSFEAVEPGERFVLQDCTFSKGFVLSGEGLYDYESGIFSLMVSVSGLADGTLTYTRDADYNLAVTGEYDGEIIDLSE